MDKSPAHPVVSKPSILFVCTANIVRSPMAAALFRARLMMTRTDWRNWRVDSAGTWADPGQLSPVEMQQVAQRRGLDLSMHRSRVVTGELLRRFNLVLTMESGHKEALCAEFSDLSGRIFMLSEMAGEVVPVSDPYGGTLIEYERAANAIDEWLSKGMDRIYALALPK